MLLLRVVFPHVLNPFELGEAHPAPRERNSCYGTRLGQQSGSSPWTKSASRDETETRNDGYRLVAACSSARRRSSCTATGNAAAVASNWVPFQTETGANSYRTFHRNLRRKALKPPERDASTPASRATRAAISIKPSLSPCAIQGKVHAAEMPRVIGKLAQFTTEDYGARGGSRRGPDSSCDAAGAQSQRCQVVQCECAIQENRSDR